MISYKLLKQGGRGEGGGDPMKKASVFVQSFINIRHRHPRPVPFLCLFTECALFKNEDALIFIFQKNMKGGDSFFQSSRHSSLKNYLKSSLLMYGIF
jgi:hypothetical protein